MGNPFASSALNATPPAAKQPLPYQQQAAQHLAKDLGGKEATIIRQCREAMARQKAQAPAPAIPSPAATVPGLARKSAAAKTLMTELNTIEKQSDPALYTRENYETQLCAAQEYLNAFVADWKGALPKGGKKQLRAMLYAIAEGSAGAETAWNPEVVKNCANRRPHTGVFQTEWAYMHDAAHEIASYPTMEKVLATYPADKAMLKLAKDKGASADAKGLPTSSFAGQAASFAAMTAKSYRLFLAAGGAPDQFDGLMVYQDHMLGLSGGTQFRSQFSQSPDAKGKTGMADAAYHGNYLVVANPRAPVNDLNPKRLVPKEATARDVNQMMRDKFVLLYIRMMDQGVSPARLEAIQTAFLSHWRAPAVKAQEMARVCFQKEFGNAMRATDAGKECPCDLLRPMPAKPPAATISPKR